MMSTDLMKKVALFAGGVLFGTAGVKVLGSKDAKKAYVQATAAVLRAKDSVMETVTTVQENAEDILAEAKAVNEERAQEEIYEENMGSDAAENAEDDAAGAYTEEAFTECAKEQDEETCE